MYTPNKFESDLRTCIRENANLKNKFHKLAIIIDKANAELLPAKQLECKRGCDACCHYHVGITEEEAGIISEFTGLERNRSVKNRGKFAEPVPCPFLKNHECSIYPVRPLACRSHFVLTPLTPGDVNCSKLGIAGYHQAKLKHIHMGISIIPDEFAKLKKPLFFADIRDFFSPGASK